QPVTHQTLVERLRAAQIANPEQPVVISADKNIRYDDVMQVMDLLQRSQIAKVGLLVQPAAK
ncbi:MAG TPA: biopolymer transporter ExbD, partial [Rhodocyclaceae bacterium]|nr:biopolymer transporter ExbD [Rhodocyclaceae bacterium]